jgi:hypothetical protein
MTLALSCVDDRRTEVTSLFASGLVHVELPERDVLYWPPEAELPLARCPAVAACLTGQALSGTLTMLSRDAVGHEDESELRVHRILQSSVLAGWLAGP